MGMLEELFGVRGQVALVTGGASGLGYAFASVLAGAGANVVIADWNADRLEKAAGSLADSALAAGRTPPAADRSAPPLVSGRTLDVSDATAVHALMDLIAGRVRGPGVR